MVTIDTLRADRVEGPSTVQLTPAMHQLAADGVQFVNAYAHTPLTLPSHASIMTGLTPLGHGVSNNTSHRLASASITLAEIVKAAGYRTGAFVGAFVLSSQFGLNQGFDEYDDRFGDARQSLSFDFVQRRADDVLRRAAEWILSDIVNPERPSDARTPWFAWVHLFDPHYPYDAPTQRVNNPYDNEVAFTDAHLGRFLQALRSAGALTNTLIVVTADHGEDLGDHGELTHGLFAYNSTLKVPLILAGPGIQPAIRHAPVSHVAVMPTVLDLLGLDLPPDVQGQSVRAELNGAETRRPAIYFEALDWNLTSNWAPLTGIMVDEWKFIDLPIPEVYDLDSDPDESTNLFDRDPERDSRLRARLAEVRTELERPQATSGLLIDADTRSRLQALGYTAGRTRRDSPPRRFTEADDPKRLLEVAVAWHRVSFEVENTLRPTGRLEAAAQLLLDMVAQHPQFAPAYARASTVLTELGRASESVDLLDEALRRDIRTDEISATLGHALALAGQPARAVTVLEALLADGEGWAGDLNTLGVAYAQLGRVDDARQQYRRASDLDPSLADIWRNLGMLEMQAGDLEAGVRAFRKLTQTDPSFGPGWRLLGAALRTIDQAAAIEAWRRAVDLMPHDREALLDLVILLTNSGSPRDARPYLEQFLGTAAASDDPAQIDLARQMLADLERR